MMTIFNAMSQTFIPDDKNPLDFKLRVKQISEFMERFNRNEIPEILNKDDSLVNHKALAMLFDLDLIEQRPNEVIEFVTELIDDETYLSFCDTTWKAVARCNAKYKGKDTEIVLELKTEKVEEYIYKWVITDAKGEILNLTPKRSNPGLRISPVDNEINFMSLNHITTNEAQNILNYKKKDGQINTLSVFFALVSAKDLNIENVQELIYEFEGEKYEFTVRYFRRDSYSSGWLISDFKHKPTLEEK